MDELIRAQQELTDLDVAERRPFVRARIAQRLDALLEFAAGRVFNSGVDEAGEWRPADVRWAELAVRILDRQAKLYRLDQVAEIAPEEPSVDEAAGRVELLRQQARMQLEAIVSKVADNAG